MSFPKTCRDDKTVLVIKQTKQKAAQLQKSYYYTAYYFCPKCGKMYFSDEFKVTNSNYALFNHAELDSSRIEVEIWTDGACSNNGRPNAKASWAFVSGDYEDAGLVKGKQTNNTGEGFAIYYGLKWASSKGYRTIRIYTDSQISLHNLRKPASLVKKNKTIFLAIENLIKENKLTVLYEKVAGHAQDVNNNRADKLANSLAGIK